MCPTGAKANFYENSRGYIRNFVFIAGVNKTGDMLFTGVNDTGDKVIAGVLETGD